jgi:hypothetical protein
VSVYVSNSDETTASDGTFLIAGYAADELKWPDFSRQWQEEILSSGPAIPYLHMTEIRSSEWQKEHGITSYEADQKVRKSVELIARSADMLTPYLTTVSRPKYQSCQEKLKQAGIKTKRHHESIDYIVFIGYAIALIKEVHSRQSSIRRIIFNIDNKKHISHHMQHGLREEMISELTQTHPELASLFGDVVPLSDIDHKPLQAADVFCWHLRRSFSTAPEQVGVLQNIEIIQGLEILCAESKDSVLDLATEALIKLAKDDSES